MESKLSVWWHSFTAKISDEIHNVVVHVRPVLEDLASHAIDNLKPVLAAAAKDLAVHVAQARADGKDLTSHEVIGDLIGDTVKNIGEKAVAAELPLLRTTAHSVAAGLVADALDLKPVNYAKLNN